MNSLDPHYKQLLRFIIEYGEVKKDRTGTGTKSIFGWQIRHKMSEGFPLLTTKKMAWKTMVVELLWFLRGDTNIKYLLDNNCNIWTGDAYKRYKDFASKREEPDMSVHVEDITGNEIRIMTESEFVEAIRSWPDFAKTWGELGPIYGKQWRSWTRNATRDEKIVDPGVYTKQIDQIANLINELKTNPDSRRLMVSALNVGELNQMVLPPCHYGFQMYTRKLSFDERYKIYSKGDKTWESDGGNAFGKINGLDIMDDANIPTRAISLMWNQRSADTFLGLPFNIASYGLLLEILAREVNMVPDELIGNLGDCHLYLNHIEQAKEQILRIPYELPKVKITERNWYQHEQVKEHLGEKTFGEKIMSYRPDCFELLDYQSHPKIKAPLSN